ncbi:MAG TPA: hypothetical protein PKI03_39255 [Pseudomonadota bacterium]|nr:hypothetical protein [Pseudomonadota bacterium]
MKKARKTPKQYARESKARMAATSAPSPKATAALTKGNEAALKQAEKDKAKAQGESRAWQARAEALGNRLLSTTKVSNRATTDVLASGGAHVVHEGMNWIFRLIAEWSRESGGEEGWWYSNVAFTQSLPGLLGTALYVTDSLLQKNEEDKAATGKDGAEPYVPSELRLGFNKWALLLSNLGLSNFIRAMRYKYWENIDEQRIKSETIDTQKGQIDASRAREKELTELLTKAREEILAKAEELKQLRARTQGGR